MIDNYEEAKKNIRVSIGTNLKKYREAFPMSKAELSRQLSMVTQKKIAISSIMAWEQGSYSPDLSLILPICKILNIDISQLLGENNLNPNIQEKNKLINYLDNLSERQLDTITNIIKAQIGITPNEKIVSLKLYNEPACAGNGNYVSSDDYEIVEFSNPPKTAKFAVRARGDSMKPLIDDGDILFINPDALLTEGEIGIFTYQTNTYVKQLRRGKGDTYVLHSLNPKYDDIPISEPEELYICGRVL